MGVIFLNCIDIIQAAWLWRCLNDAQRPYSEGGIFRVQSADTEADFYSIAEDNLSPIEFRHPDN